MDETTTVPRDEFSSRLRDLTAHPGSVAKQSIVELQDFYGNLVTWNVKTIRVDGSDTVFLQRQDGRGGDRWVLPPEVMAAIGRHQAGATTVNRKRGARAAVATRAAKGIVPDFKRKK